MIQMVMHWPRSGPNDATSYVIPGIPWVTGTNIPSAPSVLHISFPCATKFLFVRNISSAAAVFRVGFSENGVNANPASNAHYFILSQSAERALDIRVKDLFLLADSGTPRVEIIAGLSQVLYTDFPILTGSISGTSDQAGGNIPLFGGIG